jgi:hypothetical protein
MPENNITYAGSGIFISDAIQGISLEWNTHVNALPVPTINPVPMAPPIAIIEI